MYVIHAHGLLLLIWTSTLIPASISNYKPSKVWDEIIYPFPNFSGCIVEVWKWISNLTPHFIMDVITYPCWDLRLSMLVKRGRSSALLGSNTVSWILSISSKTLISNITMSSYQYRKSHYGDKTILRPSYLHNGISHTGKTTSLCWIGAQV